MKLTELDVSQDVRINMARVIRITESELTQMIAEAAERELNEYSIQDKGKLGLQQLKRGEKTHKMSSKGLAVLDIFADGIVEISTHISAIPHLITVKDENTALLIGKATSRLEMTLKNFYNIIGRQNVSYDEVKDSIQMIIADLKTAVNRFSHDSKIYNDLKKEKKERVAVMIYEFLDYMLEVFEDVYEDDSKFSRLNMFKRRAISTLKKMFNSIKG